MLPVLVQILVAREPLVAISEITAEGILATVGASMSEQIALLAEALLTHREIAYKWALTSL